MYSIRVLYADGPSARVVHSVVKGDDAISMIRELLALHQGCERVEVHMGASRLFAVDCHGVRLPD